MHVWLNSSNKNPQLSLALISMNSCWMDWLIVHYMDEWMNELINEWMNEWMNELLHSQLIGRSIDWFVNWFAGGSLKKPPKIEKKEKPKPKKEEKKEEPKPKPKPKKPPTPEVKSDPFFAMETENLNVSESWNYLFFIFYCVVSLILEFLMEVFFSVTDSV